MELSVKLKAIRKDLGLNKSELSKILGVSPSTIQNYELGHTSIPFSIILNLHELGVNMEYFVDELRIHSPFNDIQQLNSCKEKIRELLKKES